MVLAKGTSANPLPTVAHYPAVPMAVGFLSGIGLFTTLPHFIWAWVGSLIGLLLVAIILRRRRWVSSLLLLLCWGVAGLLAGQIAAFQYRADEIGLFASDDSHLSQLELALDDPPRVLTNPFDNRRAMPPKQVALARVTQVRTWEGWRPASGDVLLQISEPNPALAAGQTVRATGMLQRPAPAMNPGQFDWAGYYRDRRVLASFTVTHAASLNILADPGPSLLTAARLKARELLAAGFPAERSLDHALTRALLLGDNDPQLRDIQDQFQRTGTAHHLAISGTHIAVLGGILWLLFRMLGVRPRVAALVVMLFIMGYGALALPSPPVIRSVVLAAAFCTGAIFGRVGQGLQLLCVSVMAMLAYHPPDLFNAGFQLSFGTVLGLILLSKPTLRALEHIRGLDDPDTIAMRSFRKPTLLRRCWDHVNRVMLEAIAAGLVAWFVSMPLISFHFEQLNPWAVIAGILLAPIAFLALVGAMLKVVLTLLWPSAAATWAWLAIGPIGLMRWTVGQLARWPYADIPVPPSPIWLIVLFYGLMLFILVPQMPSWLKLSLRLARTVVALFIVLPPLQAFVNPPVPSGTVRVTLLAVGAGQCAVVQPPGGRTVLLDAGSASLADPVTKCIGPFLRHARCTGIDSIVLSHGDFDHVGATTELVRAYGVREVLTGSRFLDHEGPQARQLVADLAKLERPPRILTPLQPNPLGRDTAIEVLWPPADLGAMPQKPSSNDGCLVFRLTHAGRTILFPGDIQDGAMRELLKAPEKLKADVLVAMHHGSAEELTSAFIAAVDPAYIVSSNDRTLTAKQRAFDRLATGRPLLRTNECGAITITVDRQGKLTVEPFVKRSE